MRKTAISIRLDDDLLAWYREKAPDGYQSAINKTLRRFRDIQIANTHAIVGRAQQIFIQYHARCFWHLKSDLQIDESLIPMIQNGLRENGGRIGFLLANEIALPEL